MNKLEKAARQALEALMFFEKAGLATLPSIDAITALRQALEHQPADELVAWVDLLKEAEQIVRGKFLWKKFIDGTPLANDIPVWMADFAQQYTRPQPVAQSKWCDCEPNQCQGKAGCRWQAMNYSPLDKSAAQWQGLERDVAAAVLDHCYGPGSVNDDMIERTTEVIRAKLREKNSF